MIIGYYVFPGSGDYHAPSLITREWMFTWGLKQWKKFIDNLMLLDVNTLLIYLNGHKLPYKSSNYPELVDTDHPNNKAEFLSELFNYIKCKGIKVIAVLTTTGHAGGFLDAHPLSGIEISHQDSTIEETLVSFPEHIRKGKLSKKSGAAQLGFGVLCHNKINSRQYAENILNELIELYGNYFDGIALHPPESAYPCYCEKCCNLFFLATNKNLKEESVTLARKFFISSYLEFQSNYLFTQIKSKLPECMLFTFSIPWLFETVFEEISINISKDIKIIEWDYNLSSDRIITLFDRLTLYKKLGFEVLFMPTAGFSFNPSQSLDEQVDSVHNQLIIAEEADSIGIVHFLGPKLSEHLIQTSRRNLIESSNSSSFRSML